MKTANWPKTAWASVRLLPELSTPDAWASTTVRLRTENATCSIIPMPGTDVQGVYAATARGVAAFGIDADHTFPTRLGPSASPPV